MASAGASKTALNTPGTWRERLRALRWAWLAHTAAGALAGLAWLASAPAPRTFAAAVFTYAALVSTAAILAFVLALPLALAALAVRSWRALGIAQAVLGALLVAALYADTVVYALFRYHFNGMVWNVLTTPGAEDAVAIDAWTWWRTGIGAVLVALAFAWLWRRVCVPAARAPARTRPRRLLALATWCAIGAVVLEKGLFAWADLSRERSVTALASVFPFYQRFTVEKFVGKVLGVDLAQRERVVLAREGILLRYPEQQPVVAPAGPRPNVLLVVVDSLRADMLGPETMPNTLAFARGARTFTNHLSGGNATRYGIFSLIYGLHGAYWKSVLEEHAPPVLVTSLQALGYDLRVLSGPSQNYPEFRSTCWVTIEDAVQDKLVGVTPAPDKIAAKIAGDAEVAHRFEQWMSARSAAHDQRPFFCFALIDAPHGSYAWPRAETHFTPVAESVDYIKLARSPGADEVVPVFNMYKNAVRYADALAERMLDALRAAGELENTIVVITGDHGEEFFEHGFFGHTSNFAPEQVHVACVIGGPGIPPGVEVRPTSHLDVAPTILELLGADPAQRGMWTQGESLLAPPAERVRGIASWDEMALWVEGGILRIPIEGHRGGIEAYDAGWQRLADEDAFIRAHAQDVARLAQECRRFLR